ncbi:hypothetical protein vseg_008129 [Gypsophila vaccaria]
MKEKAINSGYFLFDNKPLIVREWNENLEINKTEIKTVPVWVQLQDLPLKFWGKSLPKIAGIIGKFIKCDNATEERSKLGYARVMVEMSVNHLCPECLQFKDEQGKVQKIEVTYEWKPISCSVCNGMGHRDQECRRAKQKKPVPKTRQIWKPKPVVQPVATRVEVTREEPRTPLIRQPLQNMQNEDTQGGYSNEKFWALSYREVLSLSNKEHMGANGNVNPLPNTYG